GGPQGEQLTIAEAEGWQKVWEQPLSSDNLEDIPLVRRAELFDSLDNLTARQIQEAYGDLAPSSATGLTRTGGDLSRIPAVDPSFVERLNVVASRPRPPEKRGAKLQASHVVRMDLARSGRLQAFL